MRGQVGWGNVERGSTGRDYWNWGHFCGEVET